MTEVTFRSLSTVAAKLTDHADRETYAALISYFDSLPKSDELFRLVELLGLLSLLGQRLPEALAESMAAIRAQTEASAEYHAQVDQRLSKLPDEIAAGVDIAGLAKSMSEAFRQQLASTGLENAAALLRSSSKDIAELSCGLVVALKPAVHEYELLSSMMSSESAKLVTASNELQSCNARLIDRESSRDKRWYCMLAALVFVSGVLCGVLLEKRQTTDLLLNLSAQINRIQTKSLAAFSKGH